MACFIPPSLERDKFKQGSNVWRVTTRADLPIAAAALRQRQPNQLLHIHLDSQEDESSPELQELLSLAAELYTESISLWLWDGLDNYNDNSTVLAPLLQSRYFTLADVS